MKQCPQIPVIPLCGPAICNVCGERLHMGCCNPSRPDYRWKETAFVVENGVGNLVTREVPPIALTDQAVRSLEAAIRAQGFDVLFDTETGEYSLMLGETKKREPEDDL